jgi:transcription antitermination factor NusG
MNQLLSKIINLPSWLVMYTKPQQEIKLAERLTLLGFEVYCPTQISIKQWSDRKKKVTEPLFKSYLFIRIKPSERHQLVHVPGFVAFVFWLGKPAIVREEEIDGIKVFMNQAEHASIVQHSLQVGQKVNVVSGPLAQQTGQVIRIKKNKITLLIHSLGLQVQADLLAQHISA